MKTSSATIFVAMAIFAYQTIGGHVTDAAPVARAADAGLQREQGLQSQAFADQASADQRHRTHADEGFAGSNGFNDEAFANRADLRDQATFDLSPDFAAKENANRDHEFDPGFAQDQASADLRGGQANNAFADQESLTDQAAGDRAGFADQAFSDKSPKSFAQEKTKRDNNAAGKGFAEDVALKDQTSADQRGLLDSSSDDASAERARLAEKVALIKLATQEKENRDNEAKQAGFGQDQASADLRGRQSNNAFAGQESLTDQASADITSLSDQASSDKSLKSFAQQKTKRDNSAAGQGFAEDSGLKDQAAADQRGQSNNASQDNEDDHTDEGNDIVEKRAIENSHHESIAQGKTKRDHNAAQREFAEQQGFNDQFAADQRQQGGSNEVMERGPVIDSSSAESREKASGNAFAGRHQDAIDEIENGGSQPDQASFAEFGQAGQAERIKRDNDKVQEEGFAAADDEATSKTPDLPKLVDVDTLNKLDTREDHPTVS